MRIEPKSNVVVPDSLRVEAAAGTLEVALAAALWTSVPVELQAGRGEAVRRQVVRGGDQVWVLGRIRKDGDAITMRATGPESLFVIASPGDVGRAIAQVRRLHRLAFLALVALAGGAITLAALLH